MMSDTRSKCCRVDSIRRSASFFLALYLVMPAASSMRVRRSSGRDETMKPIRPCSMMAYAFEPTPVPRKNSTMSRKRQGTPPSRYSLSPPR